MKGASVFPVPRATNVAPALTVQVALNPAAMLSAAFESVHVSMEAPLKGQGPLILTVKTQSGGLPFAAAFLPSAETRQPLELMGS